jgi:hypothetical protein
LNHEKWKLGRVIQETLNKIQPFKGKTKNLQHIKLLNRVIRHAGKDDDLIETALERKEALVAALSSLQDPLIPPPTPTGKKFLIWSGLLIALTLAISLGGFLTLVLSNVQEALKLNINVSNLPASTLWLLFFALIILAIISYWLRDYIKNRLK